MKNSKVKLTRKEFLKIVGTTGVALSIPKVSKESVKVNSFLDFADSAGRPNRSWWVKKAELPTIEINWDQTNRFDSTNFISGSGSNIDKYIGEEEKQLMLAQSERKTKERMIAGTPGFSYLENVFFSAARTDINNNSSLLGPEVTGPEDRGMPIWEGTTAEAARVIRVAMRQFGAAQVSFVKLDEETRKLIYSVDRDGKEIVFEKVEKGYETEDKRVIPDKAKWVISYTIRLSIENMKHAPSMISSITTMTGYSRARYIQNHTQAFISGLGYQCIGQVPSNGLGVAPGFGVLAGHGELSRLNRIITPEYGPMVQTFFMITDLPVDTDQPIDAGIMKFCKVCKKCAESCPSGALSGDDEPSWEIQGGWNNPGHRAYFENSVACLTYWKEVGSNCSICFSVCPFAKDDKAWIHSWAMAGVSTVPMLGGFLRSMDDAMSYGAQKNAEEWWYIDLPEFGLAQDNK
ncbi:MAG: reductive dehalogenase [Bacteroidetes bacterium]|jgi:epoxyqueuosine reductase|nr:reductive dehalogenase [Chloroflexota bacterium]MBT4306201.1 reductive dehalogenase [Chloroflexota bacterium]MBT6834601.1 reductive dehalogenase [Bacteroidota bacterium]MBT6988450.1 reductive dehalogenase [Chloroflexota bacterium]